MLGAVGLVLLVMSAGTGFLFSAAMAAGALWLGRRTGRRAAIVLGTAGLGLAVVAGVTWTILATQGVTPQDLQDSLQRVLDEQRR